MELVKPPWHVPLFVVVLAGAVLTAILACVRIVLLQLDPPGLSGYQAVTAVALVALYVTYASIVVWLVLIRRRLRPDVDPRWYRRLPAYVVWRVSVVGFLAVAVFAGAAGPVPQPDSPVSAYVAYDHRLQLLAGVRLVLAVICVWFAVSVVRAAPVRLAPVLPPPPTLPFDGPDARPRTW